MCSIGIIFQRQPPRGVLWKRCSENMQQIYTRTTMPKRDFNKVALQLIEITLQHGCSLVNLLHIFRTTFTKNTSRWLLLTFSEINSNQFFYVLIQLNHSMDLYDV